MRSDIEGVERVTLFSRLPHPGRSKTRLIPGVGVEAAARLHHEMALRAITTVADLVQRRPGAGGRLSLAGPPEEGPRWFGSILPVEAQPGGDLGERMQQCFRQAREAGVGHHLIIGTDAPELDAEHLEMALAALAERDMVLGPARDGGYYLIGLSVSPPPALFRDIPWGGPEVLGLTLARAQEAGLSLRLLPTLDDVDHPEDIRYWRRARRRWPRLSADSGCSVILPVLDEAERIGDQVRELRASGADEVIVVDGGSRDDSVQRAEAAGARVIESEPGRAVQMNRGARAARHPALLFLHADTRLSEDWRQALTATLADSKSVGGAFTFRLDEGGGRFRLLEWLVALRSRLLRRPYGDQGLFCRTEAFLRLGGFPEVPVMEDFIFVGRLRREGRLRILPQPATSSARNWRRAGFWRVALAHRLVILGYYLGVPLPRLARLRRHLLSR